MTVRVQTEAFDAGREAAQLTAGRLDVGAVVTFTGIVRGADGDRPLAACSRRLQQVRWPPARRASAR